MINKEKVFSKVSCIGAFFEDGNAKHRKSEEAVYRFYLSGIKQSIKARKEKDPFRMEVVCRLLNTIYFKHKQTKPVAIFTDTKKT
jgi:hypothetical protein